MSPFEGRKDPSRLYFRPALPWLDASHLSQVQDGAVLDVLDALGIEQELVEFLDLGVSQRSLVYQVHRGDGIIIGIGYRGVVPGRAMHGPVSGKLVDNIRCLRNVQDPSPAQVQYEFW